MGFDLSGVEPKTERGEYFRNNVWWWRPLWNYLFEINLINRDQFERGQYNDGYVIKRDQALKIGAKLKHLISQGEVKKYEEEYTKELDDIPDEKCDLCKGTGVRNDEIVQGECNGCNGKGKKRPWMTSYPFNEENVKEFADFCVESGGFEIY